MFQVEGVDLALFVLVVVRPIFCWDSFRGGAELGWRAIGRTSEVAFAVLRQTGTLDVLLAGCAVGGRWVDLANLAAALGRLCYALALLGPSGLP